MPTYISLLRGINVSGQKKIPMKELAAMFEGAGFARVRTYIQSGNVLFDSPKKSTAALSQTIHDAIEKSFGFDVDVLVLTPNEIETALAENPFDAEKMYLTFLFETPNDVPHDAIDSARAPSEEISIGERVVYFHCPEGYGKSKLSNNFFEAKLKVRATTRNLKTTKTLSSMARAKE